MSVGRRAVPLALLLCLFAAAAADAATVRGLVRERVGGALFPARYVAVTLDLHRQPKPQISYTGRDGRYYFYRVAPGRHELQVWASRPGAGRPTGTTIQVPSRGTVTVRTLVIDRHR